MARVRAGAKIARPYDHAARATGSVSYTHLDFAAANAIQDRLIPLHDAVFMEPGLAGAKHALAILGRMSEEIRLPMLPVQQQKTKDALHAALVHAGLLN